MSQSVILCAICGKPKAPTVTTQQAAPREAEWPTRSADIIHTMKKFLPASAANPQWRKMYIPPVPLLPGEKQGQPSPALVVNRQADGVQGVPDPPPLVLIQK